MQVFGAKKRCEGLPQVGFKLSASISSDCRWGAEMGDPCLCEGSSYSVCGAVSDWDSLCMPGQTKWFRTNRCVALIPGWERE